MHNTHLEVLELSENELGPIGGTAIAKSLSQNNTLKELNIS